MILVLIQYASDKSNPVFKFIWLATISNLFPFEVTQNANNANFRSFEKSTDSLKDRSFQRKKTIAHRIHVIHCI